mmetsp:Transcript_36908/g.57721  ORF Transcript_36908/g.57721 Transcript_36908/m.57721 type:complete len:127 (-) Transcript_36908:1025-1405(-)
MLEEAKKICPSAILATGDMRKLEGWKDGTLAGVLSMFAIHHVSEDDAKACVQEWARVLCQSGLLYFAAWEGSGPIDYGNMDMSANLYSKEQMQTWTEEAGLKVLMLREKMEDDMGMNTCYILAQKP